MREQIEALQKERDEQAVIEYKAHARFVELTRQLQKLRTLEKKMNAVLDVKITP